MNENLRKLFDDLNVDGWKDRDEKDKVEAVEFYDQNPAELEALFYDLMPDYAYQMEAKQPGAIKALVGKYVSTPMGEAIPQALVNTPVSMAKGIAGFGVPLGVTEPYRAMTEWEAANQPIGGGTTVPAIQSAAQNVGMLGGASLLAPALFSNPATVAAAIPAMAVGGLGLIKGGEVMAEHMTGPDRGQSLSVEEPLSRDVATGVGFPEPTSPRSSLAAITKGVLSGTAEALFERFALGGFFNPGVVTGPMSALVEMAKYPFREVPSEIATEMFDIGLDVVSGTGGPTDAKSAMNRLYETGKTAALSSVIAGPLTGVIAARTNKVMFERSVADIQKRLDEIDSAQANIVETALAEGQAEYLDENTDEKTTNNIVDSDKRTPGIVQPGATETFAAGAPTPGPFVNTEPVDMTVKTDSGEVVMDSEGNRPLKQGDLVMINAKLVDQKYLKKSATLQNAPAVRGSVNAITEQGIEVSLEDGQNIIVSPDQILSESQEGLRGTSTIVPSDAPTIDKALQLSRNLVREIGVHPILKTQAGKDKFAYVTVDRKTGKPVRIAYDWAIQRYPGLAQKAMTHELGHIASMLSNNALMESMGIQRPAVGSLLGKLATEYTSSRQWLLKTPVGDEVDMWGNPKNIVAQHEEFFQNLAKSYEAQGKELDKEAHKLIQANWEGLLMENGYRSLDKSEQAEISKQARADTRAELSGMNATPAEFRAALKRNRKLRTIAAYEQKGMYYLPALRQELAEVSAAVRGMPNTISNQIMLGKNATEEMYADFFSAKLLGLQVRTEGGRLVNLVEHSAPNLSAAFDAYLKNNKTAARIFTEILEPTVDADKRLLDTIAEMREWDTRYAKELAEKNHEFHWLMNQSLKQKFNWVMGGLINANIPALDNVSSDMVIKLQNELEKLNGMSSVGEQFVRDFADIFDPILHNIAQTYPGVPLELLGAWAMENRVAEGGRTKNIRYEVTDAFGEKRTVDIKLDLMSGQSSSDRQTAQKLLNESKILAPHLEALKQTMGSFHKVWNERIIGGLESSGVISPDTAEAFRSHPEYVTYAIFKTLEDSPSFRNVAPSMKVQFGDLNGYRNPITASLEAGLSYAFVAQLNKAKRLLVNSLPDQFKKKVSPMNRQFPEPKDSKNYSLVVFKENGIDQGYHVPKILVQGVETNQQMGTAAPLLALMAEGSSVVRRLLTTWQPAFLPRNMVRDFQRLYINTTNPETGWPDPGIIMKFFGALKDTLWTSSPEAQKEFDDETKALRLGSMLMSDTDFKYRDANNYQDLLQFLKGKYMEEARQKYQSSFQQKGKLGLLAAKVVSNPVFKVITGAMGVNPWVLDSANKKAERIAKRAAYRYYKPYMDKRVITKDQFEILVRHSGSPYFLNKGAWHPMIGPFAAFFNPTMQGMYEDLMAMYERPGVALNRFLALSMNYALTDAVIAWSAGFIGIGGEEWKDLYNNIPWKSRKNATCIPLMMTPSGKTVYLELPLDETTAAFKRIAWTILESRFNNPDDWAKVMSAPMEFTQVSANPMLLFMKDMTTMLSGGVPWDSYRQKPIVPPTAQQEGGMARWIPFLKHYWNSLSPINPVYKFGYDELGADKPLKPGEEEKLVAKHLEKMMGMPFTQSMLKAGMLKISDQGIHDRLQYMVKEDQEFSARQSRLVKEAADAIIGGDMEQIQDAVGALRERQPLTNGQVMTFARYPQALREAIKLANYGELDPRVEKLLKLSKSELATVIQKGVIK